MGLWPLVNEGRNAIMHCMRQILWLSVLALLGGSSPLTAAPLGNSPNQPGRQPSPRLLPSQDEQLLDRRTNRVDYEIEARADDSDRSLLGSEIITFENKSGESASDLWFHLYLNAYSNNRSTHLTESKGRLRGVMIDDGWGYQRVQGVWVQREGEEEVDIFESFRYRRPDDGNLEDRSVFSVDLPWTVPSGQAITIRIEWESKLPRVRRRTGMKGDFIYCAQWFPKLGVFEGDRGWNCHQFHMNSEWYSNFGTYDVTVDLPEKYLGKVGGSGVVLRSWVENGRAMTRFQAPSADDRLRPDFGTSFPRIHDFAWTADPDYVDVTRTLKFREWAAEYPLEVERVTGALGRSSEDVYGRNVEVRMLIQPEKAHQAERHIDATCAALFFYGLWFGAYPYEQVTVVDPAWGASAAGGMEYPTIFTCGSRLYTRSWMHSPESVTVHEAGHQFWYGLVANNEVEAAWLDEGFNSFADAEVLFQRYGPSQAATSYGRLPLRGRRLLDLPGGWTAGKNWKVPFTSVSVSPASLGDGVNFLRDQPLLCLAPEHTDPRLAERNSYLRSPGDDPVETCSYCYASRTSYVVNSYSRPSVLLRTLSGLVGYDKFMQGIRFYSEKWRYRHPYPADFYEAFIEGSGEDVGWFFEEAFQGTGTVDWRVSVTNHSARDEKGLFQDDGVGEPFVSRAEPEDSEDAEELENSDELAEDPETDAESEDEDPAAAESVDLEAPVDDEAESEDEPEGEERVAEPADGDADDSAAEDQELPEDEETATLDSELDEVDQAREAAIGKSTEILLSRAGSLSLPITVEIEYDDGDLERFIWSREEQLAQRWLRVNRYGKRSVAAVRMDPDRDYYIDTDLSNNHWFKERDEVAPMRWSERAFSQAAFYLQWLADFGG